ncbi:hypothetical protein ABIE44_003368 [Marmoricola sp. OAE513]|uniref:hypothetical protein n=1 Tax=Marmoricola sp. OAE513 TaxID=2817894 RepID=UPI001AE8CA48
MNKKYALATAGLATAIALPASVLTASPASADVERTIRCGAAEVELSVDRENGRFEVDGSIDNAVAGSKWRVALRHDGKLVTRVNRTADYEGDLDLDRIRPNTAGKDTFKFSVRNLSTGKYCSVKVVTR